MVAADNEISCGPIKYGKSRFQCSCMRRIWLLPGILGIKL